MKTNIKEILISATLISLLAGCATTKEVDVKIVKLQQDLESKIVSTENKISMTSANIDSVNKELDSLASDIAEVGKQSNTLEKKITAYEKINKINTKIASLSQAIVAYQNIIIANKNMLGSMNDQLVKMDTHIQDLAKKLTVIQQEFAQYKANTGIAEELADKQQSNTDLVQDSEEKPLINNK